MKKIISVLISFILVLSVLSGCGSRKAADKSLNQPAAGSQTITDNTNTSNQTTQSTSGTNTESTASNTSETQNSTAKDTTAGNTKTNAVSSSGSKNTGVANTKSISKPSSTSSASVNFNDVLKNAVLYMEKSSKAKDYKISDWDAIGLKISGLALDPEYIEYKGGTLGKEIDNYYMTDYARTILGVMAAGYDPNTFQGIDLVDIIKKSMAESGKFKDTISGGEDLINCHVWSMIALEACNASYDRQKALSYLEGKQNRDGGFYIFASYPDSDVDFTAMSVLALSMAGRDSKSQSVSNALKYLKSRLAVMQKDPKLETAETLSSILGAVVAAGDNADNYMINGRNIVQELLSFRDTTGGFKHIKSGSVDYIATRQAVISLDFYKNNKNMYNELNYTKGKFFTGQYKEEARVQIHNAFYDVQRGTVEFEALTENVDEVNVEITNGSDSYKEVLKPENGLVKVSKSLPESDYNIIINGRYNGNVVYIYSTRLEKVVQKLTASVRIESYDKNVLYDKNVTTGNMTVFDYDGTEYVQGKISAYSFVMKALNNAGIKSCVSYSYGAPFITSVDGTSGGKFGGWDGWMYFVNGMDPGVGMTDADIKSGDEILLYYGDWGIKPLEITVPETASKGQTVEISVQADGKAVENAAVWTNGKKYMTDANGTASVMAEDAGNLEVYAEKTDDVGKPLFIRSVKKVIVVK